MGNVHPVMQQALSMAFPGLMLSTAEDELNILTHEPDDIGTCPECGSETRNGVCQSYQCKTRLM
jgi:hypothetical protein